MKHLIIILILTLVIACSQNKKIETQRNQQIPDRIKYVSNPNSEDALCISEINKAKKDIAKGKIVFTQSFGFGASELRYEKELRQVCQEYGLEFGKETVGCVEIEGQTQACYGDYMDKIIIEKFGVNFKEALHKKADSLFLVNIQNKIVQYWYCDERPRLPGEEERISDDLPSIKVFDLDIVKDKSDYFGWPFFDLGFIVEKDSTISDFYIRSWVAQIDENEKFKDELYKRAVDYIKNKYPKWLPGKVSGVPVRTDNNVRVCFVKEQ